VAGSAAASTGTPAVTEPLILGLMLLCFGLLVLWHRWPIGLALIAAAWAGAAAGGDFWPMRHLVEGAFSFLDPILIITTAMIFMRYLADSGGLAGIGHAVERRFGGQPLLLLPLVMLIVMFPGMITGSSTASVLTTGALAASILNGLGLSRERTGAIIAMGGVLGMVAPPINIPAMIIGTGIDLPYAGFAAPLALAAFPLALASVYWLGAPALRRTSGAGSPRVDSQSPRVGATRALLPAIAAAILMLAPRLFPNQVPDPGLPLTFLIAAAAAAVCLPRFAWLDSAGRAVDEAMPVLCILVGVGSFIQVMTLTGARGWLVSLMAGAPAWGVFAAAGLSMPLFGAVSAFGSASVLGVPFLLALLGRNEIVTTAALSVLAALGDLMLPAALAATLAAQVAGVENRMVVLKRCILPALVAAGFAVLMLVFSADLGRRLG
jgi:gluconate:H+ symporter, GntP family